MRTEAIKLSFDHSCEWLSIAFQVGVKNSVQVRIWNCSRMNRELANKKKRTVLLDFTYTVVFLRNRRKLNFSNLQWPLISTLHSKNKSKSVYIQTAHKDIRIRYTAKNHWNFNLQYRFAHIRLLTEMPDRLMTYRVWSVNPSRFLPWNNTHHASALK